MIEKLGTIAKNAQRFTTEHAPTILTGIAVAGSVSTALLAAKGGYSAALVLAAYEADIDEDLERGNHDVELLTPKEKAQITWKFYLPALITGASTVVCIVGANSISSKRQAAIVTAYSISETAFKEYKAKVVEQIGETKEQKVRDEIAKDRIEANPPVDSQVIITGNGDVLCYETQTGRYFESDIEKIRKAQNDINYQVLHEGYASLNDFFSLIGLGSVGHGEQVGWTSEANLDVFFSTVMSDDSRPCISIGYHNLPVANYWKYN